MKCCLCCNKTLLVLACVALLASPWMIQAGHRGNIEEVLKLDGSSGVSEFEFRILESSRSARLSFQPSLTAGTLFVELLDPAGEAQAWGEFDAARPGSSLKWSDSEPSKGHWTLRVSRENASGRYRFQWQAH